MQPIIPKDVADAVGNLRVEDVKAIITLTSLGMNPGSILHYAKSVVDGTPDDVDLGGGAVKPIRILAYSFLSSREQYNGTYGLTSSQAAELKDLLYTDQAEAKKRIAQVVSARLSARKSPRPVVVSLEGMPASPEGTGGTAIGDDGGKKILAAIIKKNPGVYGVYRFEPMATGQTGPDAFQVKLGGNLAVHGQSKAVAISAARIVRVHGRLHQPVVRFTRAVANGSVRPPGDIPSKVWDGVLAIGGIPPPDKDRNESSVVGK